jgi:ABC-type bacteriocin/lantibiotic exporter with double-glycine peptidase domain
VQKNLPNMFIGGFTIILQTAVGLVLVSLYHPLFLLFNLVLVALVWLIWVIWGGRAIRSAIEVSHNKHASAAWLEGLAESNGFFKSDRHIDTALDHTDGVTRNYVDAHAKHFRHHFAQTLSFLLLYALASASLLGLGGWLVIQGQLSLGQLVAAELVLSVAFFGVSQLGTYLAYFYELCASIEELSLFDKIEQEKETGEVVTLESSSLKVSGAATRALQSTDIDFELPAGMRVMGIAESHAVQRSLMDLLRRYERPARGFVTVGGIDIMSILPHTLRQHVIYLARPTLVEMTMREYLDLSGSKDNLKRDLEVLEAVGLSDAIARLPDGLDTHLSVSGWPLSINETMQLRLAAAIIAEPRVLVLNQLFDVMPEDVLKRALDLLQSSCDTLVIYFTGKARDVGFNRYLHLGHNEQIVYDSLDTLIRDRADDELRASISIPGAMNPAPAQS